MFLFPACGATVADAVIIYLHSHFSSTVLSTEEFFTIENTSYLAILSITRLLFLLPLNYHTLSGTRLKFPGVYATFHVISAIIVLAHFLGFAILSNPSLTDNHGTSNTIWPPSTPANTVSLDDGVEFMSQEQFVQSSGNRSNIIDDDDDDDYYSVPTTTLTSTLNDLNNSIQASKHPSSTDNDDITLRFKLIWILLTLSMTSIALHIMILLHVRSTAPSTEEIKRKVGNSGGLATTSAEGNITVELRRKKKKRLAYWVYDKYRRRQDNKNLNMSNHTNSSNVEILNGNHRDHDDDTNTNASDHHRHNALFGGNLFQDYEYESDNDDLSDDVLLLAEDEDELDVEQSYQETDPIMMEHNHNTTESTNEQQEQAFDPSSLNPLKQRAQQKYRKAVRRRRRKDSNNPNYWGGYNQNGVGFRNLAGIQACFTDGYDEFVSEIRTRFQEAKREWGARLDDVTEKVQQQTGTGNFLAHLHQLRPFQALVHLYAHEEVFINHKLDRAFGENDKLALSFYAPQILGFLLHNAFLNTGRLEQWVLDKCRTNIYFAHRCFWFLRAWCLQGGVTSNVDFDAVSQGSEKENLKRSSSAQNNSSVASLSSTKLDSSIGGGAEGKGIMRVPSVVDLSNSKIKFSSEERELLEELLNKIIECGATAASKLEFGPSDDSDEWERTPEETSPLQERVLISAGSNSGGCPSVKHLNAATAKHAYGFIPLPNSDSRQTLEITDNRDAFLRTPDFLDSLIKIADDLMKQPISKRTTELRKRLKQLEIDMLPSNSIYVPINNCMHRVWRIVASESIALSTKERVPCIICLEVVDHVSEDPHIQLDSATQKSNITDPLTAWYKTPRQPQRHNTLLSKVSTITQKQLQKLRHDIEDSIGNTSDCESPRIPRPVYKDEDNVAKGAEIIIPRDINNYQSRALSNRPPKPPSQSRPSSQRGTIDAGITNAKSATPASSRDSSRPSSPTGKLGQWASGTFEDDDLRNSESFSSALDVYLNSSLMSYDDDDDDENKKRASFGNGSFRAPDDCSCTDLSEQGDVDSICGPDSLLSLDSNLPPPPPAPIISNEYGSTTPREGDKRKTKKKNPLGPGFVVSSVRPPPIVFKEDWNAKQDRIRGKSAFGKHAGWRLLPLLIKSNDDLRQEQLASQLIHSMASILARANVPVWLYPYEIVALTFRAGIIEAIPDTISIDSLRKNYPNFIDLKAFFEQHFGPAGCDEYENAKANFVESLAAYSIVCFLLQVKDRHNGNILLDNKGHLIHIDFGFYFLSSPGKNSGFESAPFKLTTDFVNLMDGANSHTFNKFRELCYRTFLELRKNCFQITLLVQMLMEGNEDLDCFRGRPHDAVQGLQERFRLDLNDRACVEYVNSLINDSLENWTTTCYDRYQRFCVGVM